METSLSPLAVCTIIKVLFAYNIGRRLSSRKGKGSGVFYLFSSKKCVSCAKVKERQGSNKQP